MRRDFESFPAGLAGNVIVDSHQMVLDLGEERTIAIAGPSRNLRFLRAAHPPNRVIVSTPATWALKRGRSLLRFLGEELTLVHGKRVHEVGAWCFVLGA
jgi:hypothetical protein